MIIGDTYNAHRCKYSLVCSNDNVDYDVFPFLRDAQGAEKMYLISPEHGRSYLVSKMKDGRFVISKGNGLCYSQYRFINTGEMGYGTWGMLLKEDAIRDYNNGLLASSYGIKTNRMHCVVELDEQVVLSTSPYSVIKPALLQYDVECPYRISDTPFIPRSIICEEIKNWKSILPIDAPKHVIAAEILISNLEILHAHGFLHNAITVQNYSWALELLDFEMASSPMFPYDEDTTSETVFSLFNRELLHTYQIIIFIAKVLREKVDYREIDEMFCKHGMDLHCLAV